jgi:hypothetical protein
MIFNIHINGYAPTINTGTIILSKACFFFIGSSFPPQEQADLLFLPM